MSLKNTLLAAALSAVALVSPAQETTQPEVIQYASFLPTGQLLTVGSTENDITGHCCGRFNGNRISLWDITNGQRIDYTVHDSDLEETIVSPDGKFLASWKTEECDHPVDGIVRIYSLDHKDQRFGTTIGSLGGPVASIQDVAFSPDSSMVAVSYRYNSYDPDAPKDKQPEMYRKAIRVFQVSTLMEYCWLTTDREANNLAWSPDDRYLAARDIYEDTDSNIYLWDISARKKLAVIPRNENWYDIAFTKDSRQLIAGGKSDKTEDARTFNLPSGEVTTIDQAGSPADLSDLETLLNPSGIIFDLSSKTLEIIDSKTSTQLAILYRQPPYLETTTPSLEIEINTGSVATSNNGRYVVIESHILDLQSKRLYPLDIPIPSTAESWSMTPPAPRPIMQRKIY